MVAVTLLPHCQMDTMGVRDGVNIKDRVEDRSRDVKVCSVQRVLILKIENLFGRLCSNVLASK